MKLVVVKNNFPILLVPNNSVFRITVIYVKSPSSFWLGLPQGVNVAKRGVNVAKKGVSLAVPINMSRNYARRNY